MSTTANQNIILSKVDKIRSAFAKASEKNKQVIVCKLKYEDAEMMDAFCMVEDSSLSKLDDIIITFKAAFTSYNEFAAELIKELLASFQTTKELAGNNDWILKTWNPEALIKNEKDKVSPIYFFKVLQSMIEAAPDFEDKIFAYLSPKRNENKKLFSKWISNALSIGIPKRCGILVTESNTENDLTSTAGINAKGCIINPELKMDEAIKKMATAGNPSKPDVQFRKCLFNMKDGVPKKNAENIMHWRNEAKKIAIKERWKDMIVTTDLTAGTFMLHVAEKKMAIDLYEQAIRSSNELIKENPRLGNALAIQAMASKATALVSMNSYIEAIKAYEQLGDFATAANDYMNAMEAWRMAGYCYKKISQKMKALACNNKAFAAAEFLDSQLRPHTTLPYVGRELIELTPKDEAGLIALKEIDFKMKSYVGDGWQNRYK
jgi:tetratricopeptide (TPR) repeat protein